MQGPHTVVVLLESKSGKEVDLKEALKIVAEKSRSEESCLEYRVHQDAAEPTKFALYEKWKTQALHQEQFSKPYIQQFAIEVESLLSKPYEGVFGHEIECG